MKTKLICLIGASGSGKTTIAKELENIDNVNVIQSYTTREPRYEGEWGHTFINGGLISHDKYYTYENLDEEIEEVPLIAYFNSYSTGHHYFATLNQVKKGKTNIYIVDPKGAEQVHDYFSGYDGIEIKTIYLECSEQIRENRMLYREVDGLNITAHIMRIQKLKELESRLKTDRELFQTVKCDYVVDGNGTVEQIRDLIKTYL